jgi:ribosomal protein S18 acetylase RimI-like enzyme
MLKKFKKSLWFIFININLLSLEIRPPLKHEIEEVADLYYHTWHDTFDTLSSESLVKQRTKNNCLTQWQEYYNKGSRSFVLIALEEKKIVGILFGGPLEYKSKIQYPDYDCEINKLYVVSTLKNRGIGSNLLKAGFNLLRAYGFKKVIISSLSTNTSANKFYEKKGGILIAHSDGGMMNVYGFDLIDFN